MKLYGMASIARYKAKALGCSKTYLKVCWTRMVVSELNSCVYRWREQYSSRISKRKSSNLVNVRS
jgi:hypothetical protein